MNLQNATTMVFVLSAVAGMAQASHVHTNTLGTSRTGGVRTDSAIPLAAGQWSFGVSFDNSEFDRLSQEELLQLREADHEASLHSIGSIASVAIDVSYGVTPDLTIGVHLPYLARYDIIEAEHEHDEDSGDTGSPDSTRGPGILATTPLPGIEALGKSSGIGDLSVYGQWRFFHSAVSDASVALLAGVKVPTGSDDRLADTGERLESEFQPGTGSWDPFAGLAWSRAAGPFTLGASTVYMLATEGSQNTDLGDQWTYNAGAGYMLGSFDATDWSLVLELNGGWRDKEEVASISDGNSGGTWLYMSPGLSITGKQWSVFASYGYALDDELNGNQDDLDYRFLVGFQFLR